MKKKPLVKKKKKPQLADEVLFELNGKVFIVGKKNGKEIERTQLEGEIVLNCLIAILRQGLDVMEKNK